MTQAPAHRPPPVQYVTAPSNGLATAGMVLGIIGTIMAFIPVIGIAGALLGGLGFVLGVFGFLASLKRGVGKGKAIAALARIHRPGGLGFWIVGVDASRGAGEHGGASGLPARTFRFGVAPSMTAGRSG